MIYGYLVALFAPHSTSGVAFSPLPVRICHPPTHLPVRTYLYAHTCTHIPVRMGVAMTSTNVATAFVVLQRAKWHCRARATWRGI
ncbi:unnamed protein product [Lota lota]